MVFVQSILRDLLLLCGDTEVVGEERDWHSLQDLSRWLAPLCDTQYST